METNEKPEKNMDYYLARSEKRHYIGNQIKRVLYGGLSTALAITAIASPDFGSKAVFFGFNAISNMRMAKKGNEIHEYKEKNGLYKPRLFAKIAEKHPHLSKFMTGTGSVILGLSVPVLTAGAAVSSLPLTPALGAATLGISGAYYLAKKTGEWNYTQKRNRHEHVQQELAKNRGADNPLHQNEQDKEQVKEQVKEQEKTLEKLKTPHKETLEESTIKKLSEEKEKLAMNKDYDENDFEDFPSPEDDLMFDDDNWQFPENNDEFYNEINNAQNTEIIEDDWDFAEDNTPIVQEEKKKDAFDFDYNNFSQPSTDDDDQSKKLIFAKCAEQLHLKQEKAEKEILQDRLPVNNADDAPKAEIIAESAEQFNLKKNEEEKTKFVSRTFEFAPTVDVLAAIASRIKPIIIEGKETEQSKNERARVQETFELTHRINNALSQLENNTATFEDVKNNLQSNRTDIDIKVNIDEKRLIQMIKDGYNIEEDNNFPYDEIVKDVEVVISLDGEERGTVSLNKAELDTFTKFTAIARAQELAKELNLDNLRDNGSKEDKASKSENKKSKSKKKDDFER